MHSEELVAGNDAAPRVLRIQPSCCPTEGGHAT
jgi:hypothetical protein